MQAVGTLDQRSEQELFYSCPSSSALAFFAAVSAQVAALEDTPYASNPSSQLQQVVEVVQAVEVSRAEPLEQYHSSVALACTTPHLQCCVTSMS